jgi:hypothetical protein
LFDARLTTPRFPPITIPRHAVPRVPALDFFHHLKRRLIGAVHFDSVKIAGDFFTIPAAAEEDLNRRKRR